MSYKTIFAIKPRSLTPSNRVKNSDLFCIMMVEFFEHDLNSKQPETIVN